MFVYGFCVHPNVLVCVISGKFKVGASMVRARLFSSGRSDRGVALGARIAGQNWANRRHPCDADDLLVAEVFSNLLERRGRDLCKIPTLLDRPLGENSIPGESIRRVRS